MIIALRNKQVSAPSIERPMAVPLRHPVQRRHTCHCDRYRQTFGNEDARASLLPNVKRPQAGRPASA